jgi:hypothetical protein
MRTNAQDWEKFAFGNTPSWLGPLAKIAKQQVMVPSCR